MLKCCFSQGYTKLKSTYLTELKCTLCFVVRRESNSGVYFAGMFRVANVEFIPEYRHADSSEFVSMATRVQHVVSDTA